MGRVLCPSFFNIRSTRSLTLVVCRRRTTQLRKTECLVWSGQHQIKQSQNKPLSYIQDGQCKFALEKGVAECIKKKKKTFAGTCFYLSCPTEYKMQGTSEHSPLVIIIKQHETRMCLMNVEIIPAIQTSSRRILAAS